ncbi:MAG: tRNA (adenosine(37)-N6)-dimethylallyltransferase MiaA [Pseudomonadota bacterium]
MLKIDALDRRKPVLIAGATASGKSALALSIAAAQDRTIINADALQVYGCWRVLTARPSTQDEATTKHALYGHVAYDHAYSVGEWLRDLRPFLGADPAPIIVGGTGLYFRALTEGLAEIPGTPASVREEADRRLLHEGHEAMLAELDAETSARIDGRNRMRVQRAWEVLRSTGRGLASWQDDTPPPLVPLHACHPLWLDAEKNWLNARIAQRFDLMLAAGALKEARQMDAVWSPSLPAAKAIGAPELVAHIRGEVSLSEAREAAIIATRQYAKRQRTWFRRRMVKWVRTQLPE